MPVAFALFGFALCLYGVHFLNVGPTTVAGNATSDAFVYALLWGAYWLLGQFGVLQQSPTFWVFVGPLFFVIGNICGRCVR